MFIRVFFFVQCLAVPVNATTVMAVRTPTDIYLGADSKVRLVLPDGTVRYEQRCKIQQAGDIFFVSAGPYGRKASGLDVRSLLLDAERLGGTVAETVDRFERLYAIALARALTAVKNETPMVYESHFLNKVISVFLFAIENETPRSFHRTFTHQSSEDSVTVTVEQRDCPPGCTSAEHSVSAVGYGETMKTFSPSVFETHPPIQVIIELIEASIRAEPDLSGGPVDVIHINKDGAKWVQKKDECPEIEPYKK
jgi:hypothetical protein